MRERLAYLHIPKSAGTSIRASLSEHFGAAATAPWTFDTYLFGDDETIFSVREPVLLGPASELAPYDYVEGHWSLPTLLEVFDPADVVTVLREPRSRLLSHYSFWRSWPQWLHDSWEPYPGAKYAQQPLGQYLADGRIAHQSDNLTTRLLVGRHRLVPVDDFIDPANYDELAAIAIDAVSRLGYVDVLERGAAMRADLGAHLGIEVRDERLNATDDWDGPAVEPADFTDRDTLAMVHARSALDMAVWEHVFQSFGVTAAAVRQRGDAEFARMVGRLVRRADAVSLAEVSAQLIAHREASEAEARRREQAAVGHAYRQLPAVVKGVWLVQRGPRAIIDRIRADRDHDSGTGDAGIYDSDDGGVA